MRQQQSVMNQVWWRSKSLAIIADTSLLTRTRAENAKAGSSKLVCDSPTTRLVVAGTCYGVWVPRPSKCRLAINHEFIYKVYKLRGRVVSSDAGKGDVTVDHEAIPGFMDAMTMPYQLKDANIASELHTGDVITADVMVSQDPNADVFLDHIVVVGQSKPDYRPAVQYHVPTAGDRVPDFKLRNQDGRAIRLAQFKGQALLVTFIYTRCPLPNYCPRVTRNFAEIERQLAATPATAEKTHLICVSFDS